MSLAWTPALVTGHAGLDRQHREILVRAARLASSLAASPSQPEPLQALGALAEYVYDHFDAEERLMRATGFPGLATHREAHAHLCQDFLALAERFRLGGTSEALAAGVSDFIVHAIAAHVQGPDQALAAHLASAGGAPRAPASPAGPGRDALAAAACDLDLLEHPACLLDPDNRIVHCNAAWDAFAVEHHGAPRATGEGLRGRDYLDGLCGGPVVRQVAGVLRRAQGGQAQQVASTCHTADTARLLTVRYLPVPAPAPGGVAGVAVIFVPDHVFPIGDLFDLHPPDAVAHRDGAGRLDACACCSRVRRRDRPEATWEFVPAYLDGAGHPIDWSICATCFADQFGLTRG